MQNSLKRSYTREHERVPLLQRVLSQSADEFRRCRYLVVYYAEGPNLAADYMVVLGLCTDRNYFFRV